ncbi:hypothetical protein SAMN02910292_02870 [Lachnospiraceae bacterium XBB2008]|nr:hypothetical protein SAMN02910292_02870 [Lachnospiraceae bacterium XBB2008]
MFDPFDINKDGKLDIAESFLKFETIMGNDEENLEDDLAIAGLDMFELEMMDEYERREAIEDAGLDPDDYDDLFI